MRLLAGEKPTLRLGIPLRLTCDSSAPTWTKKAYTDLAKRLSAQDKSWKTRANRIFYLALPPRMIEGGAQRLAEANLNRDRKRARIVVEKPFGRDLASARKLNQILADTFHESQVFRIDHYLGKETVQNILAFRFGNTLFEPVWNRRYIDHVQITVAEQVGVEHRGHYYDRAGALRDMVQSHLLQILCLVAMEAPVSLGDDDIRNKNLRTGKRLPAKVSEIFIQFRTVPHQTFPPTTVLVIMPILEVWESMKLTDFPDYQAGTWGPEEAQVLIAQDGFSWATPTLLRCDEHASCGVTAESEV